MPTPEQIKRMSEQPEEGSVDWLWFYPYSPRDYNHVNWRKIDCNPCQVTFYAHFDKDTKFIKCFCCGKFKRLPYRD